MARRFTLDQAERLLEEVRPLLEDALNLKAEYAAAEEELQGMAHRVMVLGGSKVDRGRHLALRARRDGAAARLRETIEAVQSTGCLIKDLDLGLLDFPALYRGEEVYLCWRLGEPAIEYWHGVQEGFRGRKPIDDDFRRNHRGDPPN